MLHQVLASYGEAVVVERGCWGLLGAVRLVVVVGYGPRWGVLRGVGGSWGIKAEQLFMIAGGLGGGGGK